MQVGFKAYDLGYREACLALFDVNCPAFFAPNERADYARFLHGADTLYRLAEADDNIVGAFGVFGDADAAHLNWIMVDPRCQGMGIGRAIMAEATIRARALGAGTMKIAASHLSAPFFARFGAVPRLHTQDGWGPGMHRIDMALPLTDPIPRPAPLS